MSERVGWSREQLIIAFKLYCEIPFGKMHSLNPEIIRYAEAIGRSSSALAMKLTNIASLDPAIRSTGRKGLTGASQADKDMWAEMSSDWNGFADEIVRAESSFSGDRLPEEPLQKSVDPFVSYEGVTRTTQIEARVRQGFFRSAVLSSYEYKCCISGLAITELLVASHIVPWNKDASNRLNPRNGLCLSSIHDRAFDLGLITISRDFRVILSKRLREAKTNSYLIHTFHSYADKIIVEPEKFSPDPRFLEYHRDVIFSDEVWCHEY